MDSLPMKMLSARELSLIAGTIAAVCPVNNPLMHIALRPGKKGAGLSRLCAALALAAGKRSSLTIGHWEIDDARHLDGKKYDLELHLETLRILKQKECL